jgi:hypothetical protein
MPEIIASQSGPISSEGTAPSSSETFGEESQDAQQSQQSQDGTNGDVKPEARGTERKPESRYERTKRQRAALAQREAELKAREERIAQAERAKQAPKKPDYTLEDLRKYRQSWENEGNFDLVEKADAEIKRLEALEQQEQGQEAFVREWQQAEADLAQSDPEFGAGKGTRLDKQLSQIMSGPDGQIYRQHPRGIVAAYHRARMELLEGDHKIALGKIQQLETELKRLTGLTSIGGGTPGKVGTGGRIESLSDFSKLSSKDMLRHLRSGAGKGGMPWL